MYISFHRSVGMGVTFRKFIAERAQGANYSRYHQNPHEFEFMYFQFTPFPCHWGDQPKIGDGPSQRDVKARPSHLVCGCVEVHDNPSPSRSAESMALTQGWRNDSRGGGGGIGSGGPREKGSLSVSKGPKPPIQLLQFLKKNSPREVKRERDHFRYILVPPGSHPGSEINGARRGRSLPVPPPRFLQPCGLTRHDTPRGVGGPGSRRAQIVSLLSTNIYNGN